MPTNQSLLETKFVDLLNGLEEVPVIDKSSGKSPKSSL